MANWHDVESIRIVWTDAQQLEDSLLGELLEVARIQVLAYAPSLAEDAPIPVNYRLAQQMQVKNLYSGVQAETATGLGGETYQIVQRPLDWWVQAALRPKRAVGNVG